MCVLNRGSKTAEGLAPPSTLSSSSHFSIGAGRRKRRREPAAHTRCCWLSRLEQISRRKKSAINRRVELFFTLFLFLSLFSLFLSSFFHSRLQRRTHLQHTLVSSCYYSSSPEKKPSSSSIRLYFFPFLEKKRERKREILQRRLKDSLLWLCSRQPSARVVPKRLVAARTTTTRLPPSSFSRVLFSSRFRAANSALVLHYI